MDALANPGDKVVLVVDDDQEVRTFLETLLKMAGFQARTAENGIEALKLVKEKVPDLIITDLMMPDGSGFDFLRNLKVEGYDSVPVIVCTARKMDFSTNDMIRAESNVVEIFPKPISVPTLTSAINSTLKVKPADKPGIPDF